MIPFFYYLITIGPNVTWPGTVFLFSLAIALLHFL